MNNVSSFMRDDSSQWHEKPRPPRAERERVCYVRGDLFNKDEGKGLCFFVCFSTLHTCSFCFRRDLLYVRVLTRS